MKITGFYVGRWGLPKKVIAATPTIIFCWMTEGVSAASKSQTLIIKAFNPIIDLMQGVAYPLTFLVICGGFLMIMLGNRHKGLEMLKWAAIGYVGLQLAPALMGVIVEVGAAIRAAQ
jgi:hypothetical protein